MCKEKPSSLHCRLQVYRSAWISSKIHNSTILIHFFIQEAGQRLLQQTVCPSTRRKVCTKITPPRKPVTPMPGPVWDSLYMFLGQFFVKNAKNDSKTLFEWPKSDTIWKHENAEIPGKSVKMAILIFKMTSLSTSKSTSFFMLEISYTYT